MLLGVGSGLRSYVQNNMPRKSKNLPFPLGYRGILYMKRPKNYSLFGLGLLGYLQLDITRLLSNIP